ncbi:MAG: NAD-dependent epimerase/dehydratase family protein [Deltaproteobacteria bacterium]|nr:NAD-dependent epimerase/dehydratase family protein [Deltaproteobacteria bacterium]MCB9788128.1 NAD-dependent epimerase/dehydratase family protein [Deltaproteobacteria bacterium]
MATKAKQRAGEGSRVDGERARAASSAASRVAITGACTYLGQRLIAALERDASCEHIVALDIARPLTARTKTRFVRLDLTHPDADETMAATLEADGITTLCHLAFLGFPSRSGAWAHELEAIGTLYVMNAAAAASVHKVVMSSTTMVYGPYPDNPNYLSEQHPMRGLRASRWVSDKVGAERELARLAKERADIITTSLRFAPVVGPAYKSLITKLLRRAALPRLMGFDPLMQFLHEEDAVAALLLAVRGDHPGPWNIVPEGVLYYSQVLKLGGKLPLPLPRVLAAPATTALWNLELLDMPGRFLDYFRYSFCADGSRAYETMGFSPRYSTRAALESFFAARSSPARAADLSEAS